LTFQRLGVALALAATIFVGASTYRPHVAEAQPAMPTQVESTVKGAVGLGLVGAELGFVIPALVGLHEAWAFVVFPIVGGAGGAIGGYFAFDQPQNVELSVAFLAIGMALILPATVITLVATSYDPGDEGNDETNEEAYEGEFGDEPEGGGGEGGGGERGGEGGGESEATRLRDRALAGAGMLHLDQAGLTLGVPAVAVRGTATPTERVLYGAQNGAEVNVPLVSGAF
jgi:hypothetical protein